MSEEERVEQGFIEQSQGLESMRASDFDCYSAYGEIIDNSIQARARLIKIHFDIGIDEDSPRAKRKLKKILFADNGHGMNQNELHKCLKIGYSSRYNDRSGIGRFGVGMTFGAINQCKRIEVYSKSTESPFWFWTYLDLDEVKNGSLKFLPFPKPVDKPDYNGISDFIGESGTIVKWIKYDRLNQKLDDLVKESKIWLGRTFRKFIWGQAKGYGEVSIIVNDKEVNAIDPLFVNKKKTGFESEDPATEFSPILIKKLVPPELLRDKQHSVIKIRTSILPETYTRKRFLGDDSFARERFFDKRNEGLSIMRNDREVFNGLLPYTSGFLTAESSRNVSRFVGCEISFNAELDDFFLVKNVKRGAVPRKDLKAEIVSLIRPTFDTQIENVKERWNRIEREEKECNNEENTSAGISDEHETTNKILKEHQEILLSSDRIGDSGRDNLIARKIDSEATEDKRKQIIDRLKENGITIDEREFIGDAFIEMQHGGGMKLMLYNTDSTFYQVYKEILNEIKGHNEKIADDYKVLIDLIFVGYLLAESKINPEENAIGQTFMEDIKSYWGRELARITRYWKK